MPTSHETRSREERILKAMSDTGEDFGYRGFVSIAKRAGIADVKQVRRDVRRLARKGLMSFGKGLWTEDGDPAGSGYCITPAGRALADAGEAP
jgi:hypothetical protein